MLICSVFDYCTQTLVFPLVKSFFFQHRDILAAEPLINPEVLRLPHAPFGYHNRILSHTTLIIQICHHFLHLSNGLNRLPRIKSRFLYGKLTECPRRPTTFVTTARLNTLVPQSHSYIYFCISVSKQGIETSNCN